jgi:amino acid transporter
LLCCRPTRCRRSPTQPISSSRRWWWRERPLWYTPFPISLVITALLAVVAFSYRQTIHAYPTGGGAYRVAKENISPMAGLIAAASLLVDYTLTVSVSISAGVLAITSAFPSLDPYRVELCLFFLAMLTVGNLRGLKESGQIFAIPTYFFVVCIFTLIAAGLYRYFTGGLVPVEHHASVLGEAKPLTTFLLLTAFANGCTAMTGVEAVSDGVPAFRPPEAKNAAATLVTMAVLAITMFLGITFLAHAYQVIPTPAESGVSQLGRAVFGRGPIYYLVQAATTLILVLAANTAYADFPRLASIVSRDGFLPRQFMNQGDRLAFSNGILVLSAFAALLIFAFRGDTQSLLPLYMIGVFISFTLSQTGMVIHWRQTREPGWKTSALINGFGALTTGVVLIIVAVTKTFEGAWIVLVLIPIIVMLFRATRRHYDHVGAQLTLRNYTPQRKVHNTVLIPIGGIQRAVVEALRYAETLSDDVRGVYVDVDPAATDQVQREWDHVGWTRAIDRAALTLPIGDGAAARIHRAGRERAARRLRDGDSPRIRAGAMVAAPAPQSARVADQGRTALPAEHGRHERTVSSGEVTEGPSRSGRSHTTYLTHKTHLTYLLS